MKGLLYSLSVLVLCANSVTSAVLAVMSAAGSRGNDTNALHVVARTIPVAGAALAHVFVYSPASLCTMAWVLGLMQLGDFAVGIYLRDTMKISVPLVFALVTLMCAIPLTAEAALRPKENG